MGYRSIKLAALMVVLGAVLSAAAPDTFADQTPPPAPDYSKAESWAARPGGAVLKAAPGASPAASKPKVDVFYISPTTYRSAERWNQDIADQTTNAWNDASAVARQASPFDGCCRVFAPRYRQASSRAFGTMAGEGAKAYDLAYTDVLRAFDDYLRRDNHGRPFILAGHSQGGFHVARLLEDRIDGTPLARRLVAAYVVGYNLSEGDFGKTYKTLHICQTPTETGCVVQWNSILPGANLAANAKAGEARYITRYGDAPGKTVVCVNPLTFDRARPAAAADRSLGAVPGDPGAGPMLALQAKAVAARCDGGYLVVDPAPDLGLKPLPGGSMHFHDIGLFYADVRANAIARSEAFLKRR